MPSSLLHEYTTRIDQRARRPPHPGQYSHSRQSSSPSTSSSKASSDESDVSEQFAASEDWPPSPHAVVATDRLPADTSSPAERPPSQDGTRSRETEAEDSSLPASPRKRQKISAGEISCNLRSNSPRNSQARVNEANFNTSRGIPGLHGLQQSSSPSPPSPSPLANVSQGVQKPFSPTNNDTQNGIRHMTRN